MIKGDYDKLTEISKTNQCAEHKKPLEVCWDSEQKAYALRCGDGHYPDAINRLMSFAQEVKQGKHEDVAQAVTTRRKHEALEKRDKTQGAVVSWRGVPDTDVYNGEKLSDNALIALVEYAWKYHLDPVRSHVCIYHGRPYITIDGYLFYANRSKTPYQLRSRPMTTEEIKQYKIGVDDHAWIAEVNTLNPEGYFIGLGIVTADELTEKSTKHPEQLRSPVVAKHPQLLAQKRAEWQALRRAFPIGESESPTEEVSNK